MSIDEYRILRQQWNRPLTSCGVILNVCMCFDLSLGVLSAKVNACVLYVCICVCICTCTGGCVYCNSSLCVCGCVHALVVKGPRD